MRGGIGSQMTRIFEASGVNQIGESKHDARNEVRETLEANGESVTSANIASQMGIFSYGTAETYLDRWVECGKFAKEEFGLRDMEKLDAEHIRSYLESKVEDGVAYATYQVTSAAMEKLEVAMNMYSEKFDRETEYNFRGAISEVKESASAELTRFTGDRSYDDPWALINALDNDNHRLAASIQHEAGVRVNETAKITEGQLRGLSRDEHTDKEVGKFEFVGKGGKINEGNLSPDTYERLVTHIAENGSFQISADSYRNDLKNASAETNQDYNGSHGLRWSFAQERVQELQEHGHSLFVSHGIVSAEMGHNRVEITEHYTKG
jgi:integrase